MSGRPHADAQQQRSAESKPRDRISFVDPQTLMRIKSLQLRARIVVDGVTAGIHRSPYHGFSVEFSEYRQYSPGDDLRYFDWRLYARTDRNYVKRFEDETNLLSYVVVDSSRSMNFGSGSVTKWDYARTMAATIAYYLYLQHDGVGLMTFDEEIVDYIPPRHRPGHLRRVMAALDQQPAGLSTNLNKPLDQIAQLIRGRGMVVLLSDLLVDCDVLRHQLACLRARGHDVLVLRVMDEAEIDFSFGTVGMFRDLESNHVLYIDPDVARESYLAGFQEHAEGLREACRDCGADYLECTTNRPLELTVYDLLRARMQRGRQPLRNRGRKSNA